MSSLDSTQGFRTRWRVSVVATALSVLGCGWAVASLWYPWAVDGPHAGTVADQDGWHWMALGDVVLVLAVGFVLSVVAVLVCSGRPTRRIAWLAGGAALGVIALTIAGVTLVWWLTGWDFIVMDDGDLREYGPGGGPRRAVTGLALAALGVVCAVRSQPWKQTPRPVLDVDAIARR